jgi:hypothetical protein
MVRCYHGLGDTIQFARFLPDVARRAASVVVWAQPALLPLLATIDAPLELLPLHDGVPEVDYEVDVEIMELAWLLRTTLATLPATVPYLHVEPDGGRASASLDVGVVWRAGDWDAARSMTAADASCLADVPGVTCVALEPQSSPATLAGWRGDWQPCDSPLALARTVAGLDVLVSVDTMAAHLAGALGVPVCALLGYDADWRWMVDRHDTPWYRTMRLFRQPAPGAWEPVLADVVRHLVSCVAIHARTQPFAPSRSRDADA